MPPVSVDKHGFILGFSYHDGFLDGVLSTYDGKEVNLGLRSLDGVRRVLTLRSVTGIHVEGFRAGNVVSDLLVYSAAEADGIDELKNALKTRLYLETGQLPPNARVFWLLPSYGAEVVAVCREVEISDVGTTLATISQA